MLFISIPLELGCPRHPQAVHRSFLPRHSPCFSRAGLVTMAEATMTSRYVKRTRSRCAYVWCPPWRAQPAPSCSSGSIKPKIFLFLGLTCRVFIGYCMLFQSQTLYLMIWTWFMFDFAVGILIESWRFSVRLFQPLLFCSKDSSQGFLRTWRCVVQSCIVLWVGGSQMCWPWASYAPLADEPWTTGTRVCAEDPQYCKTCLFVHVSHVGIWSCKCIWLALWNITCFEKSYFVA